MTALVGAPRSAQLIIPNELPVLDSTVKKLSSGPFDCGDVQVAWHNIGLASTRQNQHAPKPNQQQIDDYIRRLVWYTTQPANKPWNATSRAARRKKMRHLFSAIRTLRGHKNLRWDWEAVLDLDLQRDRAFNLPYYGFLPAPLPWPQMQVRLAQHWYQIDRRTDRFEPVGNLHLTRRERRQNFDEIPPRLIRYWNAIPFAGGFTGRDVLPPLMPHRPTIQPAPNLTRFTVLNWPDDGNSLWHCLSYVAHLGQRISDEWMITKAAIWKYFNYVIHHPGHIRHRLYVHLERQSWTEIEQHTPGSEVLWGRMSILRALHLNIPNSGPPMYGHFQGMMQVIADFFCKEVILFTRPPNASLAYPAPQYNYQVFGTYVDGQTNGQILLVTDAIPGQYQVVAFRDGQRINYTSRRNAQDPLIRGFWGTRDRTADDRWGWINAPWFPPRPLPQGPTGIMFANAPYLDPQFNIRAASDQGWQFTASGVAVDIDARYGNGAVPVLPDPVAAGWQTERIAPVPGPNPYPEFPYGFGNRMIVTGVYTDANGDEWWPQWNNTLAYQAHQFHELALERDLPTTRHKLSQP